MNWDLFWAVKEQCVCTVSILSLIRGQCSDLSGPSLVFNDSISGLLLSRSTDAVFSTSDVICFPFSSHSPSLILNFSLSYQQLSEVYECFSLSLQYRTEIDRALVSLTFTLPVYVYAEKDNEEKMCEFKVPCCELSGCQSVFNMLFYGC